MMRIQALREPPWAQSATEAGSSQAASFFRRIIYASSFFLGLEKCFSMQEGQMP